MHALLDDDERQIQDRARVFLEDTCPPIVARRHELEGGFSKELWRQVLELGWLDTSLPEDVDGLELPIGYMCLIIEEIGRAIAPLPVISATVPALLVAEYGSAAQKALIPDLRAGEALFTFGLQDQRGAWNQGATGLSGRIEGNKLVLNGARSYADNFEHASHVLVSFENGDEQGLALVEAEVAGLSARNLVPMSKESQAILRFDNVRVPADAVLAGGASAVAKAKNLAALFAASYMAGAARKAMELTVGYVSERNAFGQPIGAFQAIQHTAADMIIGVDGAELLSREAAWRLSNGEDPTVFVSQAKAFANDKCVFVARSAQQLHGGIGFIMEFDIQLYYRRIVSYALRFGTTHEHRARVADTLFSLDRKIRTDWSEAPEPSGKLVPSSARLDLVF